MKKHWTIFILLFLVLTTLYLVGSVTRSLSDTQDNKDTLVRNSNGKYWEPTGANIQAAIDDVASSGGGTVWVGSDITLTSTINMKDNVQLDFLNNEVTLNNDIEFVRFEDRVQHAIVINAIVYTSASHTEAIITLYLNSGGSWDVRSRYNLIENIKIYGQPMDRSSHEWIGIHILMDGDGDISMNTFRNIFMWGAGDGILLECNHNGAYANGNVFEDIFISGFVKGVWFESVDDDAFGANVFDNVKLQTIGGGFNPAAGYQDDDLYGVGVFSGNGNHFDHCLVWDWYIADKPQYQWRIGANSWYTRIDTHASAKWGRDDVLDEGLGTTWEMGGANYPQIFTESYPPSGMPDNTTMLWVDTDNDRTYLCFFWKGDRRIVELT